jgi:hypothetical protein
VKIKHLKNFEKIAKIQFFGSSCISCVCHFRDLPTGVTITVNPANFDGVMKVGEKGYVYSGIQYKFNCIKGYQYASGKTEQTLICKGGDLKYYDVATGKNQATIDEVGFF